MWTPQFACPECRVEMEQHVCHFCGRAYEERDGVWRFLTPERAAALEPFVRQYTTVRDRDGHRRAPPEFYRSLPSVPRDDPHANEWHVRRETYHHLLQRVLASGPQPIRVLDLGAGSGWLAHRLTALGHHVVAVDVLDDGADGLGAWRHYPHRFLAVQADYDALPFEPRQFDVIVFNGSLHYAPDPATTLARAHSLLAPRGTVVVMDSPLFRADRDGSAMVDDKLRRFTTDYGIPDVVRAGAGYLTFAQLRGVAETLRLDAQFVRSRGPLGWRLRRQVGRVRLRRAPAAFGLWMAR